MGIHVPRALRRLRAEAQNTNTYTSTPDFTRGVRKIVYLHMVLEVFSRGRFFDNFRVHYCMEHTKIRKVLKKNTKTNLEKSPRMGVRRDGSARRTPTLAIFQKFGCVW